ncbi:PucR family transcriptional regulator [Streptomyces sp. NRRL F-5123]|uniref:PucR family transcriptional regulator n=1 Tax=Streptomyces sp. NRRL F-5123 TaxID=1463856 RepID=UPI0004E13520|nr:PucR family transcriptional regulator ligand-binding domain-containing protein [Streptomyces sp. NRRL F-5123]
MRLRALLDTGTLGLRLLGGEAELDRTVRGVMTTDLRDPSRYLSGGELVLTGLTWRHTPADSEAFVRLLAAAGVAALAVGEAELRAVPDDLVEACARHRLPLFAVDERVAFATITEYVARQVSGERAGDLAAVVERHRRLMSSGPAGGGPDAVLDLLGSDLDLRAWVLSATGREIAGPGRPLPPQLGAELAGAQQAAARTGRRGPYRIAVQGRTYSLFPVSGAAAGTDPRARVLTDWFLAVEADAGDWPDERLDLLRGVTQLIAVERDRRDAARAVARRLAGEIFDLVAGGGAPAETGARLRAAAPVLAPGAEGATYWQIVVAAVDWPGGGPAAGPAAQALLEEVLAGPAADGPGRVAVAHAEGQAMALLPLAGAAHAPGEPGGPHDPLTADSLHALLRGPLARGLGDEGRLTAGVSAAVSSPEGLRGALEEARHARRVAAARPGTVSVAGHEELASHVLLLPFVPDDVRRAFTARLLDPLRAYDRRHRSDLITTLEAFLDCDGSWTRCATRLHLHVNTLRYRITRIEQLTGRDLSRLEDKLDFFLALRMS